MAPAQITRTGGERSNVACLTPPPARLPTPPLPAEPPFGTFPADDREDHSDGGGHHAPSNRAKAAGPAGHNPAPRLALGRGLPLAPRRGGDLPAGAHRDHFSRVDPRMTRGGWGRAIRSGGVAVVRHPGQPRPWSVACLALRPRRLDRRTAHAAKGTEDATVAGLGRESGLADRTFVAPLANVGGHGQGFGVAADRAGQPGGETKFHSIAAGAIATPTAVGARVGAVVLLEEVLEVDVGVLLGGRQRRVAEELLDRAQIRPPLQEVGGVGVAQGVGGGGSG